MSVCAVLCLRGKNSKHSLLFEAVICLLSDKKRRPNQHRTVADSSPSRRSQTSAAVCSSLRLLLLEIENRVMNIRILSFNHHPVSSDLFISLLFLLYLFTVKQPLTWLACPLIWHLPFRDVPQGPMRTGAVHPLTVTQFSKVPCHVPNTFISPTQKVGGIYWLRIDIGGLSFLLAVYMQAF